MFYKTALVIAAAFMTSAPLFAGYVYTDDRKEEYFKTLKAVTAPSSRETVIASEGLRLKTPEGAVLRPIPVPEIMIDEKGLEVFESIEAWRAFQLKVFAAGRGVDMLVAKVISNAPPSGGRVVLTEYLRSAGTQEAPAPDKFDAEKWFRLMFDIEILPDGAEIKGPRDCVTKTYTVTSDEAPSLAVFTVSETRAPFRTYGIVVHMAHADEAPGETSLLASSVTPGTPFNRSGVQLRLPQPADDPGAASLYFALLSVSDIPDWRMVQAGSGVLLTNSSHKFIQPAADEAAKNLRMIKLLFVPPGPMRTPLIRIFSDRSSYLANAGVHNEGKSMLCRGRTGEILSSPIDFFKSEKNFVQFFNVLRRTMWYQHLELTARGSAPWFAEGTSGLIVNLSLKGRGFTFETPNAEETAAEALKSRYHDCRKIVAMPYKTFWAGEDHRGRYRPRAREAVRGLAFFLYKGAPAMKKFDYAAIPYKYYRALAQTGSASYASEAAWSGIDMEQFNRDYISFLESKSLIAKAKNYDVSSMLAAIYKTIPERYDPPPAKKGKTGK